MGDAGDASDDLERSLYEGIPQPVRDVLQPVFRTAFRLGKVTEVFPYPQQHYLLSLSQAWSQTLNCLSVVSDNLTGAVGTITNHNQADWHAAMTVFCSALWGATAWGGSREGHQWAQTANSGPRTPFRPTGSQPVMSVLFETAEKISKILREYAEAAEKLNHEVWEELRKAIVKAAKDLFEGVDLKDGVGMKDVKGLVNGVGQGVKTLLEFDVKVVLNLNTAAINRIVTEYQTTLNGLTARFEPMGAPLDEAHLSAPKFEAGVARAHGFGGRALDEFKEPQRWLAEDAQGKYTLDLASNEWLENGHTLDKHVGKTDDQLVQRLRDQQGNPGHTTPTWPHGKPVPSASSSFASYEQAQRLTQYNIDRNSAVIKAWLAGPPDPATQPLPPITSVAPNGEVSGRSVQKAADSTDPARGWQNNGMNAKVEDVHGVQTMLRYSPNTDPKFTVITSMPTK